MENINKENHLKTESSPYLLRHANNPVNWYPWGKEAFNKAREEDKPIFLSIGYSTCHHCHRMEQESFTDKSVADILNQDFVAVKVDREERPEIDFLYMLIAQNMTGRGGWPLSIVMTPDKKPFYAATYLPKTGYKNVPGLVEILPLLAQLWKEKRRDIQKNAREIETYMQRYIALDAGTDLSTVLLDDACDKLEATFDSEYGGFGPAPKFPSPHKLLFLMRYAYISDYPSAMGIVDRTLTAMCQGGIYDHVGLGFSRYSSDPMWLVPSFEKMLSDNALLAITYLQAFQYTEKKIYARVAREILNYLLKNMRSESGGFYTAEDADTEGEEGKYYLWDIEEIEDILGNEADEFLRFYNIGEVGNINGKFLPNRVYKEVDEKKRLEIEPLRIKLLAAREKRVKPFKDTKILTAWNGLAIAALSLAARVFSDNSYLEAAEKTAGFVLSSLRREDGRLMGTYYHGKLGYPACANDYSYLIWGLIELYQSSLRAEYLAEAARLNDEFIDLFWDKEQGGFYYYGSDSEQLILRPKEFYDGDMPSNNSVGAYNLIRLARLTGKRELQQKAQMLFKTFGNEIINNPLACGFWLWAGTYYLYPGSEIILMGKRDDELLQDMLEVISESCLADWLVILADEGEKEQLNKIRPSLEDLWKAYDGETIAFISNNGNYGEKIEDLDTLLFALHTRDQMLR